jgi:hypothetical protein
MLLYQEQQIENISIKGVDVKSYLFPILPDGTPFKPTFVEQPDVT